MQTRLSETMQSLPEAKEVESILRACVHCGFCNATCPTYQLLGDELDGPRGRIYLLKQMFEGGVASRLTQQHLDCCLTCRNCETTCPSGVRYGRLLDISRPIVAKQANRPLFERLKRALILQVFPYRRRFTLVMGLARLFSPLLGKKLQHQIPPKKIPKAWPKLAHPRKMLILSGCVQNVLRPEIDLAAANVLDKLGISLLPVQPEEASAAGGAAGCCGALAYHLEAHEKARQLAKNNIDACWPLLQQGAECIVMSASGCGVHVKEYAELLQHDPVYRERAQILSMQVKDLSEVLAKEDLSIFSATSKKIAFQSPCTLQHGQQLAGLVESILTRIGWQLLPITDEHLCCGSAGVYSLLQSEFSTQLRHNKLTALQGNAADMIATANIGCLMHLRSAASIPVRHWIELLD